MDFTEICKRKISNYIIYILYKLSILHKYNYIDKVKEKVNDYVGYDQVLCHNQIQSAGTKFCRGYVMCHLMKVHNVNVSYYYFKKDGGKRICQVEKNEDHVEYWVEANLIHYYLVIGGQTFLCNTRENTPIIKVAYQNLNSFSGEPVFKTVNYSLKPLKDAKLEIFAGTDTLPSQEELNYIYDEAVNKFTKYLDGLTLNSLTKGSYF